MIVAPQPFIFWNMGQINIEFAPLPFYLIYQKPFLSIHIDKSGVKKMTNLTQLKQGQKGFVAELNTNDENILKSLYLWGYYRVCHLG